MRKIFSFFEILILVYLIIILYFIPSQLWSHGMWAYGICGISELIYYIHEKRNMINPGKVSLIETRLNYLSFDSLIIMMLIILFIYFAVMRWFIISQNQLQIMFFSLITSTRYMLFTNQKRSVLINNHKIVFNEMFVRDIYFNEIDKVQIDEKKYNINILLKNYKKCRIRIKEEFYNENRVMIKKLKR